jgi:hypothetical protein
MTDVRLTRMAVDVLVTPTGIPVRLTRLAVDVLVTPKPAPQIDVLAAGVWVRADVLGVGEAGSLHPVEIL